MPHRCVVFQRLALTPALVLSLAGCVPAGQTAVPQNTPPSRMQRSGLRVASAAVPTNPRALAAAQVQAMPLYHQAEAACQKHQYRQAARLLQHLAASSPLSEEEHRFVLEQQDLCLRDAGLPVPPRPAKLALSVKSPAPSLDPSQADCGPRALALVCRRLGINASLPQLRQWAATTGAGTSMAGLTEAAHRLGLQAEGVQVSREALPQQPTPAVAYVNGNHFLAVLALNGEGEGGTALIHDPNHSREETISQEQLLRLCSGYLLLLRSKR